MQIRTETVSLPVYGSATLSEEMSLFHDWLLATHLQIELNDAELEALDRTVDYLIQAALSQPQGFVHRDYHSRNLLYTRIGNPGILDFQDAVLGPVTYDLVSLLRDCYISWPPARVRAWALQYLHRARAAGTLESVPEEIFIHWFDLMGVQRHLKAAGIFARLYHRDGKPGYLNDIPRTLNYIIQAGVRDPELEFLRRLLQERVLPRFRAE